VPENTNSSVAVLGTGIMGAPIARNLARAGFDVRAFNRTRAKAEPLADDGVVVADSPAEAVRGAKAVVTMVSDADACEALMGPPGGSLDQMANDAIWLQMSTVGIPGIQRLKQLADRKQITFVDAPVLGTKQPAEKGELLVLASGPAAAREVSDPIFDPIAKKVTWLGDAETGSRLKLVLNNWLLCLVEGTAESIAFAESIGLDPSLFFDAISGEAIDSPYAQLKGSAILKGELSPPSFPLKLARKDAQLVLEAADGQAIDLPAARVIADQFAKAVGLGHGDDDMAAVYYASKEEG
jgi:3-hydroxyisobutyrate dehydrogenase